MRRAAMAAWAVAAHRPGPASRMRSWDSAQAATAARARAFETAAHPSQSSSSSSWSRYLLFLPPAIAAYLCHWQVDRKAWKEAQLAAWAAAVQADPISLSSLPPHAPELTRVTATGTLAHDRSALIGPRPRSAPGGTTINGFLLVTPLLEGGGGPGARVVALIARGWVPAAWKEGAAAAEPAGRVTLPTVLRTAEAPSRFVPPNRPGAGEWHWLDPDALAAAAGADGPVPLLEALAPDDDAPTQSQGKGPPPPMDVLGGRTGSLSGGGGGTAAAPPPSYPAPRRLADLTAVAVTPADHRNYAVTWGTLAAATAGLAVRAGRRR